MLFENLGDVSVDIADTHLKDDPETRPTFMSITLAFDVYGTLINPHAIASTLQKFAGEKAGAMSLLWRDKQLEYSFRRGLMGVYQDFSIVTRNALDFACESLDVPLSDAQKQTLMSNYQTLDAFADTRPALTKLRADGHRMYAFSNGVPKDLVSLMNHARIDDLLDGIVSVHDVASFKPDPKVYEHFNTQTQSDSAETWLISSNPFDVIGAVSCGWKAAWVQRSKAAVFDPWEFEPTVVISSLAELGKNLR